MNNLFGLKVIFINALSSLFFSANVQSMETIDFLGAIQTRESLHEQCSIRDKNKGLTTESSKLTVFVDNYPPYIAAEGSTQGSAARVLRTLGLFSNTELDFSYLSYGDAEKLMMLGREAVSYPYFFTEERAKNFLFSCPIAMASIQLYFNRQYSALADIDSLDNLKVGVVKDNSYGALIDAEITRIEKTFDSELEAIVALDKGKIDVLPMAKGVMDSFIKTHFAAQKELFKPFEKLQAKEAFRVMAPRTEYGKKVISELNQAISLKFGDKEPDELTAHTPPNVDVAELIPAEGFPAIVGTSTADNQEYTLPIGTRVIVLDWSDGIRNPNSASSINRSMMLTSKVVVLNGPHVSKEMLVRNMHIQLK